jgi:hypothetical protein
MTFRVGLKILGLSLVVALCASCSRRLEPQEPCGFGLSSINSQRVLWHLTGPVVVYLHASVPDQAKPAITRAVWTWNEAAGREVLRLAPAVLQSSTTDREIDGDNVIYWNVETWYRGEHKQAVTIVRSAGATVYDTDIFVNAHDYALSDGGEFWAVDIESLLVHELGHVLGLLHSEDLMSSMYYSLGVGDIRRGLSPHDVSNIRCGYQR